MMDPFHSANLSPISIVPLLCALPYGLTWEELQPALPGFDPQKQQQAQVFTSHAKQGLNGGNNSGIFTIDYPTAVNHRRRKTLFIKHIAEPKHAEAQKFRYLTAQGVPLPRLLAAVQHAEEEVLLLEFLPVIGIDFTSDSEVRGLLQLAAKINAVQDPPDLFKRGSGMPQAKFDALVLAALLEIEQNPARAGVKIKLNAARVLDAYQSTHHTSQHMPLALNHNQFSYQQVGQDSSHRLVVFDLDTLAPAPRFTDIAGILYSLSSYSGRTQIELFKIYLEFLSGFAPFEQTIEEALVEFRTLRICEMCESLPWLVDETRNSDAADFHKSLAMTLGALWEDLTTLGLA
jgi:hypothetical protein